MESLLMQLGSSLMVSLLKSPEYIKVLKLTITSTKNENTTSWA